MADPSPQIAGRIRMSGRLPCLAVAVSILLAVGVSTAAHAQTGQPGAPTGLSATTDDEQVTLSWTDPGVASITKYQLRYADSIPVPDNVPWADIEGSSATTTSHTVTTGLINGYFYGFEIRAVNASGEGPAAAIRAQPSINDTPVAPTIDSVGPGSQDKDLDIVWSWKSASGCKVDSYNVQYKRSDSFDWSNIPLPPDDPNTVDGGSYEFYEDLGVEVEEKRFTINTATQGHNNSQVGVEPADIEYAVRIYFWSFDCYEHSEYSAVKTGRPLYLLGKPSSFSVTAGDAKVTLAASVEQRGPEVQKWEYTYKTDGGTYGAWTDIADSASTSISGKEVTGLTNGTEYTFKVRAVHEQGEGAESDEATATPVLAVPEAPADLTAAAGNTEVTLTWTLPTNASELDDVQVRWKATNDLPFNDATDTWTTLTPPATTYTVTGLTNGTEYTFAVRARNSAGTGPAATTTATPNIPPTVANPIGARTMLVNATITVELETPGSEVFTDADGDTLTYTWGGASAQIVEVSRSDSTLTLTGKTEGTASFTVTAHDGNGGTADDTVTVTVELPNNSPTVANPIADQTVAVNATASVELETSGSEVFTDGDGDTLSYTVTSSDTNVATVALSGTTVTVTGVARGTATITVTADDGNGGTVNDELVVTVPNRVPVVANPIADQTVAVNATASVELETSGSEVFMDGDGDTLIYTVTSSDTNVATVALSDTTVTVTGAAAGTSTVTVTADDGNAGTADDEFVVTVPDTQAPRVASIVRHEPPSSPTNAIELTWRVTFSEPVVNVSIEDFNVAGTDPKTTTKTVTAGGTDAAAWDVKVEGRDLPVLTGTVTLEFTSDQDIEDAAGNPLTNTTPTGTNDNTFVLERAAPRIYAIWRYDSATDNTNAKSPTNLDTVQWLICFNETLQDGDAGSPEDYVVSFESTITEAPTLTVTVPDSPPQACEPPLFPYILEISGGALAGYNGTASIAVDKDAEIRDLAGNKLMNRVPGLFNHNTYELENTAPTLAITGVSGTVNGAVVATFTFSEPVTGFEIGEIALTNADASEFAQSDTEGAVYTARITPKAAGEFSVGVAENAAQDAAGNGNAAATTVTATYAPNNPPVVDKAIPDAELNEGKSGTVDLSEVFSDPDKDPLTFSAVSSDTTQVTVAVNGSILTYTSVSAGKPTVTVTADDGKTGGTVSTTFTVTVHGLPNDPPTVVKPIEDLTLSAGEQRDVDVSLVFNDPDKDPLTYTASSDDTSKATVTVKDATVTVTAVSAGKATVTVTADDDKSDTVDNEFEVTVEADDTPSFGTETIADQTYTRNTAIATLNLPEATGGNRTLTYSLTPAAPAGLAFDANARTLTGTPAAVQSETAYTYTATDADGDTASLTFNITIAQAPTQARTLTYTFSDDGSTVTIAASGSLDVSGFNFDRDDVPSDTTSIRMDDTDIWGIHPHNSIPIKRYNALPDFVTTGETSYGGTNELTTMVNYSSNYHVRFSTFYKLLQLDSANFTGDIYQITNGAATFNGTLQSTLGDNDFDIEFAIGNQKIVFQTANPATVPVAPTGLTATAGSAQVDLAWANPNDSNITKYQVRYGAGTTVPATATWADIAGSGAGTTSHTVTGLTNGEPYSFEIRAVNARGNSDASEEVTAAPRPGSVLPENFTATPGDTLVILNWTLPSDTSEIKTLRVRYQEKDAATWQPWVELATDATTHTFTGLTNGRLYTFHVGTVNSLGGTAGQLLDARPRLAIPDAPTNFTATAGDTLVDLSWDLPTNTSEINQMHVRWKATADLPFDDITDTWTVINDGTATTYTVRGLTNGTGYTFEVRAINTRNNGPAAIATATPRVDTTPSFGTETIADQNYTRNTAIATLNLPEATGGNAPLTYSLSPTPPAGLAFDATNRTLTGTPSTVQNATAYTYTVTDADGDAATLTFNITIAEAVEPPASPSNLIAIAGDTKVTLVWTDPNDPTITGYQVLYQFGSDPWEPIKGSDATTTRHTVENLVNGTEYTFQIRAVAGNVPGDPSIAIKATPQVAVPDAPDNLTATAGDRSVSLSWDLPTNASVLDKVQVRHQARGETTWEPWTDLAADATTHTVTNLKNGQDYFFEVRAESGAGIGPAARTAGTPKLAVPGAPTEFTATAGDTEVDLNWKLPTNTSEIVTVQVRWKATADLPFDDARDTWTDLSSSTATDYKVTGLTNGTGYTFEVRASNKAGNGPPVSGAATPRAPPLVAPGPPTGLSTVPGDTEVVVLWTLPTNTSQIDSVELRHKVKTAPDTGWSEWSSLAGTAERSRVTGLVNGTDYLFEVRAVNTAGTGPSASVEGTPELAKPSAPSNLQASAGDTQVTLTWDLPDKGTVDRIDVRHKKKTDRAWSDWTRLAKDATTHTETGLDNGVTYEFEVRATNKAGSSDSVAVAAQPKLAVPDAPGNLTAAAGDGAVSLTWGLPTNTSEIDKMQVAYRESGAANYLPWVDLAKDATSYDVTGLTNGTEYNFIVRALNGAGRGAEAKVDATPEAPPGKVPSAPADLAATAGDTKVALAWTQSRDRSITKYQFRYAEGTSVPGGESWTDIPGSGAGTTGHEVTGLANDTLYAFEIRAVNADGEGEASAVTATPKLAIPEAPGNFTAKPGDALVDLSWDLPTNTSEIYMMQVAYREKDSTTWQPWVDLAKDATTRRVTGLTNGTTYTFIVRAVNRAGRGAEAQVDATPVAVPTAPTGLAAAPGDTQVVLSWTLPTDSGVLTKVQVRHKADTVKDWEAWADLAADATTHTVTGLTNGQLYNFEVRAENASGAGAAASVSATPVPPLVAPGAPTNLSAVSGDTEVVVLWTLPTNTRQIDSVELRHKVKTDRDTGWSEWSSLAGTAERSRVTGLANGTDYVFEVRAVNTAGTGPSASVEGTPKLAKPSAPSDLEAEAGDTQVTLTWMLPDKGTVDKIEVRHKKKTDQNWSKWTELPADATTRTVQGLTNGVIYEFEVRATNTAGSSASVAAAAQPKLAIPEAPPSLTATAGDSQVILTWTLPTNASEIGDVQVRWKATADLPFNDATDTWTGLSDGTATTYTATGLTNGTDYTFEVRAINTAGNGPAATTAVKPVEPPNNPPVVDKAIPDAELNEGKSGTVDLSAVFSDPDKDPLTFSAVSSDTTRVTVAVDGSELTYTSVSAGKPTVTVTADDGRGGTVATTFTVTVHALLNDPPIVAKEIEDLTLSAGETRDVDVSLVFNDPDNDPLTYTASSGDPSKATVTVKDATVTVTAVAAGAATVTVTADDGKATKDDAFVVTVEADDTPSFGAKTIDDQTYIEGVAITTLTLPEATGGNRTLRYTLEPALPKGLAFDASSREITGTPTTATASETYSYTATDADGDAATLTFTIEVEADDTPSFGKATVEDQNYIQGTAIATLNLPEATGGNGALTYSLNPAAPRGLTFDAEARTLAGTPAAAQDATTYTYAATDDNGDTATLKFDITIAAAPAQPRNFKATAGDTKVTLTWDDPRDPTITKYQVSYSSADAGSDSREGIDGSNRARAESDTWEDIDGSNALTTSHTVEGLANETTYTFRIRAVAGSIVGTPGPPSDATTATPMLAIPEAPTNFTAKPGDALVDLSWDLPTNTSEIYIMQVAYREKDSTTWQPWVDLAKDATTRRVTGLTNGTTYTFIVRAVNRAGRGAEAEVDATPVAVPTAPTGLAATVGDTQVSLSWTLPTDSGVLTKVQVRHKADTATDWEAWADLAADATTHTVTGLTNGQLYNFEVRAENASGGGAAAAVSATPTPAPGAPTKLSAVPGDTEVVVLWTLPTNTSQIDSVELRHKVDDPDAAWSEWSSLAGTAERSRVTGLVNGTAYVFEVRAVNTVGTGPSASVEGTPKLAKPSAPSDLEAEAGDTQVTLTWMLPDKGTVDKIEVRHKKKTDTAWEEPWQRLAADATTLTVTGLTNGVIYEFEVRATNTAGSSASVAAAAQPKLPIPEAPTNLTATAGDSQVILSWTLPTNASEIGDVQVRWKATADLPFNDATDTWTGLSDGTATTYTATGLTNGTDYTFEVRAINTAGNGPAATTTATPALPVPSAPAGLTATAGNATVWLAWTNPQDSTITKYQFRYVAGSSVPANTAWTDIPGSGQHFISHTITTGLTNGIQYAFQIRAANATGYSDASATVTATPTPVPAPPRALAARGGDTDVQLSWANPNDSTITKYQVRYGPGSSVPATATWADIPESTDRTNAHRVTGLINGTQYAFQVRAVNAFGPSGASRQATATPFTPPAPLAPPNFVALQGANVGEVNLTWGSLQFVKKWQLRFKEGDGAYPAWDDIAGGAFIYRHQVTGLKPGATYTFQLRAVNSGGDGDAAEASVTLATVPTVKRIERATPETSPTNADELEWRIVFSERVKEGQVHNDKFEFSYSPDSPEIEDDPPSLTVRPLGGRNSCRGSSYFAVKLSGGALADYNGTVTMALKSGGVIQNCDLIALEDPAPTDTNDNFFVLDNTAPTLQIAGFSGTVRAEVQAEFTFNEEVTGFEAADLTLTNATASEFAGSGANYTATITPTTDGVFSVGVAAGVAQDAAGNGNAVSNTLTATYDSTPNRPPIIASPIDDLRMGTDPFNDIDIAPVTIDLSPVFTDPDGDTLSYTAISRGGRSTPPAHNRVDGDELELSPSGRAGLTTVEVTAHDGRGGKVTDTFIANVVSQIRPAAATNLRLTGGAAELTVQWNWKDDTVGVCSLETHRGRASWFQLEYKKATLNDWKDLEAGNQPPNDADRGAFQLESTKYNLNNLRAFVIKQGGDSGRNDSQLGVALDPVEYDVRLTAYSRPCEDNFSPYGERSPWSPAVEGSANVLSLVPAAPTGLTATAGDAQVVLAWTDPQNTTITKYQLRYGAGSDVPVSATWEDITGSGATTTSHTVTSLTNGTEYAFEILAVNANGNSDASDTVTATPEADTAPSFVGVTVPAQTYTQDVAITTLQLPEATDGNGTLTYSLSPDAPTGLAFSATNRTLTGTPSATQNATPYTYTATDADGETASLTFNITIVADIQPSFGGATVGNQTYTQGVAITTLNLPEATGGNAPLTYSLSPDAPTGLTFDATNRTLTGTPSAAQNATDYTYTATDADGDTTSLTFDITIAEPPEPPAKPTNLKATAGDTQVALTWDDPKDASITKYQFRYAEGTSVPGGESWTDIPGSGAGTTGHEVKGLTNDTLYAFEIRAVSADGAGEASAVTATPKLAIPEAPTNFTAKPGDALVDLSWDLPTNTSEIYIMQVAYREKDSTTWQPWVDLAKDATTRRVTGLTNGTTYTFIVRAVNRAGRGAEAEVDATPVAVPTAPTGLAATVGDTQVSLSWTLPTDSGVLTKVQVRHKADTATNWEAWADLAADATTHTVTGLTNGQLYNFEVRAVNASGGGAAAAVSATPTPAPGAPTKLSAVPGDTEVVVLWTLPTNTSQIDSVELRHKADTPNAAWSEWSSLEGTAERSRVTGLVNGTKYVFEVRAVNTVGTGPSASVEGTPKLAKPSAPSDLEAEAGDTQVTLTWDLPDKGTVDKIEVRHKKKTDQNWGEWTELPADATTHTVQGLTNGVIYEFEVRATNTAGSSASVAAAAQPKLPIPEAPTNLTATAGDSQVILTWTLPTNASEIGDVQVRWKATADLPFNDTTDTWTGLSDGTATTYTATGLTNGTLYTFEVRATNTAGNGPAARAEAQPEAVLPAAPSGLKATAGNEKVTLDWTDPGHASITKYQVRYAEDSESVPANVIWADIEGSSATTTSHTVTGLTNGSLHAFEVRAVNAAGEGPAAAVTATPSIDGRPVAPTIISVGPGSEHKDLDIVWSWSRASSCTIDSYNFHYKKKDIPDWSNIPLPPDDPNTVDAGSYEVYEDLGDKVTNKRFTINEDTKANNVSQIGVDLADTEYDVRMYLWSNDCHAHGVWSNVERGRPLYLLLKPTDFSVTAGDAKVTLAARVEQRGPAVQKWQYTYKPDGGTYGAWTDIADSASTSISGKEVTGLTNGTEYTFKVRAVHEQGAGAESDEVKATPVLAVPEAPAALTAVAGDSQVILTWTLPTNASVLNDVQVRWKATNELPFIDTTDTWTTLTPPATTYTVTGLTNGTEYTFAVRARNSTGTGPAATTTATPTAPPRVASILRQDPASSPTNADEVTWRVTFSKAVEKVTNTDFTVAGAGTPTVTVAEEGTGGTTWDVKASAGNLANLDGTVTLSFADAQDIADAAGNLLEDTTPTGTNDNTYVLDNTKPRLNAVRRYDVINGGTEVPDNPLSPTNLDSVEWFFAFTETVRRTEALVPGAYEVSFEPAITEQPTLTVRPSNHQSNDPCLFAYRMNLSGGGLAGYNGTVTIALKSDAVITDCAGNALENQTPVFINQNTYEFDNTGPTVDITGVSGTVTAPVNATFTFIESVTGFEADDITVTNGEASEFAQSQTGEGKVYTAKVTPWAEGQFSVDVAADVAEDGVGNGNQAATTATATFVSPPSSPTSANFTQIVNKPSTQLVASRGTDSKFAFTPGSTRSAAEFYQVRVLTLPDRGTLKTVPYGRNSRASEADVRVNDPVPVTDIQQTRSMKVLAFFPPEGNDSFVTSFRFKVIDRLGETSMESAATYTATLDFRGTTVDSVPDFTADPVAQEFTVGKTENRQFVWSNSGNGKLKYTLDPAALPAGLTYDGDGPDDTGVGLGADNAPRFEGTPTRVTAAQTYTLTVSDTDTVTGAKDEDTVTFAISVVASQELLAAPTNLTAKEGTNIGDVDLSWDAIPIASNWQVRYKQDNGAYGAWTDVPNSDATTTGHTVTNLMGGGTYTFQVRAENGRGFGPASEVSLTLMRLRVTPDSLRIHAGASKTFTVVPTTAPSGTVSVAVASDNTNVTVEPTTPLTFSATDYTTPKTVTVTMAQDAVNPVDATVSLTASGGGFDNATASVSVSLNDRPNFGTQTIATQNYTQYAQITPLTLPEATGGEGTVTYSLAPALVEGLTFKADTRILAGNPLYSQVETLYTYTATDADGDTATLTFNITIASGSPPNHVLTFTFYDDGETVTIEASGSVDGKAFVKGYELDLSSHFLTGLRMGGLSGGNPDVWQLMPPSLDSSKTQEFEDLPVFSTTGRTSYTGKKDILAMDLSEYTRDFVFYLNLSTNNPDTTWLIVDTANLSNDLIYNPSGKKVTFKGTLMEVLGDDNFDVKHRSDEPDTLKQEFIFKTATPSTVPAKPTGLTATAGDGQVKLVWTNPSDSYITKYQLRYGQGASVPASATWADIANSGATTTGHTVPGLTNGQQYAFEIRAVNVRGEGDAADEATATPANTPPEASDNTVTIDEDTAYTFDAADFNFSDTDAGGALASVKVTGLETAGALRLSGADVTQDQVITAADIDADNLTFTPAANANGDPYASFQFSVNDGTADSAVSYTMTIDVTPVNDAPTVANAIGDQGVVAGSSVTVALETAGSEVFADVDGDTLTYSATSATETAATVTVDNDANAITLAGVAAGASEITVTASDGNGGTATTTFTVRVTANTPPEASDNTVTIDEDTAYTFDAADFNFSDTDAGGALASVKVTGLETAGALRLSGADVTQDQVITAADIDADNLTFTPAANANGDPYASFRFSVNDGTADSAAYTMTIDVTPVNDAPTVANAIGTQTVVAGSRVTVALETAGSEVFADVDGDTLTYSATSATETAATVTVDNDANAITLAGVAAGTSEITVTANDGNNGTATTTFTVGVTANTPPTASDNTVTIDEDTAYTFDAADFSFSDTDAGGALASVKVTSLETVWVPIALATVGASFTGVTSMVMVYAALSAVPSLTLNRKLA